MKYCLFAEMTVILVSLSACGGGLASSSCRPVLPELPGHWKEILGEADWRLEWIDEEGNRKERDVSPGREDANLSFLCEWTSPVLAWPYWPARGLRPGMMRPAGALFPWDVSGGKISLSWRGGVEAVLWKEMAAAAVSSTAAERLPWKFDWPRFRELMESQNVPEAVRLDPWLADWKGIAVKTVRSGFDRRRIVLRMFTELVIPGLDGRWTGSSPFASPLETAPGNPLTLNVTDTPDTWVSSRGTLKCSGSGWVFRPSQAP